MSATDTYVENPVMQSDGFGRTVGIVARLKHLTVPSA